ncbi:MAG: class I SAM-dependent methyltransferase [Methanomassiliicoccales archaeon]|nr:class I SAM-dependent methyltransferase [Methanomassiliicoccales archaeon]
MTEFKDSDWTDGDFVDGFLDAVDLKIPQRQRMFDLAASYYRHFLSGKKGNSIMDLGCGDGVLTRRLLDVDGTISAVLVDASPEMIEKARKKLSNHERVKYVNTSFEEMIRTDARMGPFDLVISSLAIHHLTLKDKRRMFQLIYRNLGPGGHFVNIDTMLPPTESLENWYLELWEEWMRRRCDDAQFTEGMALMNGHHQVEAHHACLDTLTDQLALLKDVGFTDVDVVFKDGIYTIYCGRRP